MNAAVVRHLSEGKDITIPSAAPLPPAIPQEPVAPLDFSPHIEWNEFPREVFDQRYPWNRDECVRGLDESFESTIDELTHRYGIRTNAPTKGFFWGCWVMAVYVLWWELWSLYRAAGYEVLWPHWKKIVETHPNCPVMHEEDFYLDWWVWPSIRESRARKHETMWSWKPAIKRNATKDHQFAVPMEYRDPSEWQELCDNRST